MTTFHFKKTLIKMIYVFMILFLLVPNSRSTSFATAAAFDQLSLGDNIVTNGSFEAPIVRASTFDTYRSGQTFGSWTVQSGTIDHISRNYWQASDGVQSVDVTGSPGNATIYQDLTTIPGQTYLLSFDLAGNPEGAPAIKQMEVWWGTTLVDTVTFDTTGNSKWNMGWRNHAYTVTATSVSTQLAFKSLTTGYYGPVLDMVNIQEQQEPSEKPPLILVHGWQGLAFGGGYHCSNDGNGANDIERFQRYDSTYSNSTLGSKDGTLSLADWLSTDYEVWIAHLETSPIGTPPLEANARCLRDQINAVYRSNSRPITLVAHSMGGVVSRAAIRYLDNPGKVKALYTLGSPHAGLPTEVLSIVPINCDIQWGACDMSISHMASVFNPYHPNKKDFDYYFIGGDASSGLRVSLLKWIVGINDGLVGSYSAVGWIDRLGYFVPNNWPEGSLPLQYWTHETHSAWYDPNNNYYSKPQDQDYSYAYKCINALMKNEPAWQYCEGANTNSALPISFQEVYSGAGANTTTPDPQALTELKIGHLDAGQSISIPLAIDSSAAGLFYFTWIGESPGLTLTRPDNQLIDPAYVAAHPTETTYETFPGGADAPPYIAYYLSSMQPGYWYLNISATGVVDYQGFAAFKSGRVLTAQTDADIYQIGDIATVTASLDSSGIGLTGATVTATLKRSDNVMSSIPLIDLGNGNYINTYVIPDAPGYLTIDITAVGSDNGVDFSRQEKLLVAIAPNSLQLTGNYGDRPRDNTLDGLFDYLDFTAQVNLMTAGEYAVSAELYAGDQLITQVGDFFNLNAGTQTITLPFDGGAIRRSHRNGPYTIKNLYFIPIDIGITAAKIDNPWTTDAYFYSQFLGSFTPTFQDAAISHWAWEYIERLYAAGVTSGCNTSPMMYCPTTTVTRDQMAVFLMRGKHGPGYTPPPATGVFQDVPTDYWAAAWIEQLAAEGITSGCSVSPKQYCPTTPVTRDQMAVFLLRAKYGSSYVPPEAAGIFQDVPPDYWAADWIEQLAAEGITSGCSISPMMYCPITPVTRDQMAVFLVRAFNLP